MMESTIGAKGRTTVPSEVREQVGAMPGTRLVWHVMQDGRILVRAKATSILDMAAMVKPAKGTHVPIEAMNAWRRCR